MDRGSVVALDHSEVRCLTQEERQQRFESFPFFLRSALAYHRHTAAGERLRNAG